MHTSNANFIPSNDLNAKNVFLFRALQGNFSKVGRAGQGTKVAFVGHEVSASGLVEPEVCGY